MKNKTMKKIEKLERVEPEQLMGMIGEVSPQWVAKELNEIIDYLNQSQKQPENLEDRIKNAKPYSLIPVTEEELDELRNPEKQEEWEREDWKLDIRTCLLFDNKTQSLGMIMSHEQIRDLEDFISQLLSERTGEAKLEIIDDIWEEARGLASWDEHDGVIPISQVESCLPEAIKNVEEKLSKLLKEKK